MNEIIFESPARITMEFTGRQAADFNGWVFAIIGWIGPRYTKFSS